jgi:hypothetical protein
MRRVLVLAVAGALLSLGVWFFAIQQTSRVLPPQDQLKKKLDDKLAEPWLKDGGWIADYDKARAEAKKSGKLICAYFTRSYSP